MTIDADAQDASPVTLAAARAEFDADLVDLCVLGRGANARSCQCDEAADAGG
jgi:hypothetical protein